MKLKTSNERHGFIPVHSKGEIPPDPGEPIRFRDEDGKSHFFGVTPQNTDLFHDIVTPLNDQSTGPFVMANATVHFNQEVQGRPVANITYVTPDGREGGLSPVIGKLGDTEDELMVRVSTTGFVEKQ